MRNPTNVLLTGVAVVDIVTMVAYGVLTVYLYLLTSPEPASYAHSSGWVRIILLENAIIIGSHTISTVLLVELAAFRCWMLYTVTCRKPGGHHGVGTVSETTQKKIVTFGFIIATMFGIFIALPTHLIYQIKPYLGSTNTSDFEEQMYRHNPQQQQQPEVQLSYWFEVRPGAQGLEQAHFVIYGCFVKILASILIFILTTFILVTMQIARKRYIKLQNLSTAREPTVKPDLENELIKRRTSIRQSESGNHYEQMSKKNNNPEFQENVDARHNEPASQSRVTEQPSAARLAYKARQSQRATIMLIVLVISFVLTEAPQGVVNTLVAGKGECFHNTIYVPLGDILDLAVLLNSSVNFILYCTMSQLFRANFVHLMIKLRPVWCTRLFKKRHSTDDGDIPMPPLTSWAQSRLQWPSKNSRQSGFSKSHQPKMTAKAQPSKGILIQEIVEDEPQ
ncbi:hypothetical protein EG68_03761 [Paragonimus skrjabini miyazakii]|uniref:G-protein coupled receptors family 1 profile domain-containing protein n=1 Tax=Paragonimus skrjabini miyazakii TaxID=59628 RepID=A0A8S9YE27_9TREM|nr:hypothetical protein EG68_03761 [Paragonimus skrjabini miyazakii]